MSIVKGTYVGRRVTTKKTLAHFWQFDGDIGPLHELVKAVPNHDDRAALIARITAVLWRR